MVVNKEELVWIDGFICCKCLFSCSNSLHITSSANMNYCWDTILHHHDKGIFDCSILQLTEDECNIIYAFDVLCPCEAKRTILHIPALHMARLSLLQWAKTQLRQVVTKRTNLLLLLLKCLSSGLLRFCLLWELFRLCLL